MHLSWVPSNRPLARRLNYCWPLPHNQWLLLRSTFNRWLIFRAWVIDFIDDDTLVSTNVLPPHRGGAVPSPMRLGRNRRTDLPRGSTGRLPPSSRSVFLLGRPLTGHNWASPLLLIDWTPFWRLLILALVLISGNVHPNPGPISNHPHPRYPCSICHLDVGRDFLQCSACL